MTDAHSDKLRSVTDAHSDKLRSVTDAHSDKLRSVTDAHSDKLRSVTEDRTAIHVDQFLAHPPERVWQALVDPELLSAWFMPTDFAPVVGHRFTFRTDPVPATGFSGVVACEVLDVRPGEYVRFTWTDPDTAGGLDSTVSWMLHPEGRGTCLFLEHRGFDPGDPAQQLSRTIMSKGWPSHVVRRLGELLDRSAV